jgi:dTDP-glucose 4,6-dehydratase
MRILVTGGAGFIGSNFIHLLLEEMDDVSVINVDKLTYAGNLANLEPITDTGSYTFIRTDIADSKAINGIFKKYEPQAVVHFAAESHVDRSIEDAAPFIQTNVLGTQVLLAAALEYGTSRFLHVSTDEVYGSLQEDDPAFTETTPLAPNSPYSASKASSDLLVHSYNKTFGLDTIITRCSNNYGPYQFPEKLIPLMINNALGDKPLPVYGDGRNIRDWIYVTDHCRALSLLLEEGIAGQVYNIGGNSERRNLEVVQAILRALDKPESLIEYVQDRPGHDWRYAIDSGKIKRETGWEPSVTFEDGLQNTVQWYLENSSWVENVITGEYQEYYDRVYGKKRNV